MELVPVLPMPICRMRRMRLSSFLVGFFKEQGLVSGQDRRRRPEALDQVEFRSIIRKRFVRPWIVGAEQVVHLRHDLAADPEHVTDRKDDRMLRQWLVKMVLKTR